MTPVVACLVRLQVEKNNYLGMLLLMLHIMKSKLNKIKQQPLKYAKNLVAALLDIPVSEKHGFNYRFGKYYEGQNVLMATALIPYLTLHGLRGICPDVCEDIKDRVAKEEDRPDSMEGPCFTITEVPPLEVELPPEIVEFKRRYSIRNNSRGKTISLFI